MAKFLFKVYFDGIPQARITESRDTRFPAEKQEFLREYPDVWCRGINGEDLTQLCEDSETQRMYREEGRLDVSHDSGLWSIHWFDRNEKKYLLASARDICLICKKYHGCDLDEDRGSCSILS